MNDKFEYKNFIEGKGIYLREVRLSDVNENYYKWLNDPEVNRYLETKYIPQSFENIKQYVEKMNTKADEIFLAICLKEGDLHIGNIKLGLINWIHRYGEVSLIIGEKTYWRKGYASEAIQCLTDFAFKTLGLHKLISSFYDCNKGSIRAFEKAGYVVEGVLKGFYYFDRHFIDRVICGIVSPESE